MAFRLCLVVDRCLLKAVDLIFSWWPVRFSSGWVWKKFLNFSLLKRGVAYSFLSVFLIAVGIYCGSPSANLKDQVLPGEVTGFKVMSGNGIVHMSWEPSKDASRYMIFMDDDSEVSMLLGMHSPTEGSVVQKSFAKGLNDAAMLNGKKYAFQILANNDQGDGAKSDKVYAMPRPDSLANLGGVTANRGPQQVTLRWDPVNLATKYVISKKIGTAAYEEIADLKKDQICNAANECTYVDMNLTNGTRYHYKVIAVMAIGIDDNDLENAEVKSPDNGLATAFNTPAMLDPQKVNITHALENNNGSHATVTLIITPPTMSGVTITGYKIETLNLDGTSVSGSTIIYIAASSGANTTQDVTQPFGVDRRYRVTAQTGAVGNRSDIPNNDNVDDVSSILSAAPVARNFAVSNVTNEVATLQWSKAGTATHYTLTRIVNGNPTVLFTKRAISEFGTGAEYTFEDNHNLGHGEQYRYTLTPIRETPGISDVSGVDLTITGTTPRLSSGGVALAFAQTVVPNVDTFVGIGSVSGAHSAALNNYTRVVPAASRPFGLVRVSTINTRRGVYFYSSSWGYRGRSGDGYYEHNPDVLNTAMLVQGFSMNSLSGPGCPVKFDFPFMAQPNTDSTTAFKDRRTRRLNGVVPYNQRQLTGYEVEKVNNVYQRKGAPGYLKYTFKSSGRNPNMDAEFTASRRAGIGRFTFHGTPSTASIIFTSYTSSSRDASASSITYDSTTQEIKGIVRGGEFCNPGSNGYRIYMVAQLDETITSNASLRRGSERVVIVNVPTSKMIHVKFALSYTSYAKARLNLAEITDFDFAKTKKESQAEWAAVLSTVAINDANRISDKKIFYTALWRMFQHPTIYQDIDGSYRGFDDRVHNISEHTTPRQMKNMFTDFSGWDIYRFQTQMLAFLIPEAASDMAQSLTVQAEQAKISNGKSAAAFPRWTVANDDAIMMHGNPGQIIVANMYTFGAKNFDIDKVWNFSKTDDTDVCSNNRTGSGFGCLSPIFEVRAFLQNEVPGSSNYRQGVYQNSSHNNNNPSSKTLEYATAEFAKAQIAKGMYDKTPSTTAAQRTKRAAYMTAYNKHIQRAGRWREVIARSRSVGAGGTTAARNFQMGGNFYEGTAAQYRWVVPYDGKPLFGRGTGGNSTPLAILESHARRFETATDKTSGMYMGNQVCLATPWLFNYVKKPTRTQHYVRAVMTALYKNSVNGALPGNDDLGTLSGWYVSAALGIAPTIPAVPVFLLNTPYFSDVTINRFRANIGGFSVKDTSMLDMDTILSGKPIKIMANSPKTQKFIAGLMFKKSGSSSFVSHDKSYVKLSDIQEGGTLKFTTTATESQTTWATSDNSVPPSMSKNKTTGSTDAMEYTSIPDEDGFGSIDHTFALPVTQ